MDMKKLLLQYEAVHASIEAVNKVPVHKNTYDYLLGYRSGLEWALSCIDPKKYEL